jgi:pimeloyl-ACP methyl ester carboxylesterase
MTTGTELDLTGPTVVDTVEHHTSAINGVDLHYVTLGEGAPVIFCHGVPHVWYTWFRQLPAVAAAGRMAVALDVRGMGRSSAPSDPASYPGQLTHDLLGLLDELGSERAVFAGFDIGMNAIWDLALRAPERVEGIVAFNTPILAPPGQPGDMASSMPDLVKMGQEHFYHVTWYNADPPAAVTLLNANTRDFLRRLIWALSGDYRWIEMLRHPVGTSYLDALPETPPLPWSWFSEYDLDQYVEAFEASGFQGVVDHYNSFSLPQPSPPADPARTIEEPVCFIGGDHDMDLADVELFGKFPLETMRTRLGDLREVKIIRGAGHLVHLERPDEVNATIVAFLESLDRPSTWR